MDLCEPLNKAHSDQRKAERALCSGDIPKAIKGFTTAADNFSIAESNLTNGQQLTLNSDIHVLEALTCQRQFCLRQVELLTEKLRQIQRQWSALMEQQKKLASLSNLDYEQARNDAIALGLCNDGDSIDAVVLKQRVLEKMKEQDSLLEILVNKETTTNAGDTAAGGIAVSKCPKTDKVVIEELRQCNEALRQFIAILLAELEAKTMEIEKLRKDIRSSQSPSPRRRASTTPSKKNSTNGKRGELESGKLPELPPLELPTVRLLNDREML